MRTTLWTPGDPPVSAELARAAHHPQQVGPGRHGTFGKRRRHRHLDQSVRHAHAALDWHATMRGALGAPIPTGHDIIRIARTFLGKPYCAYGCRCSPTCWCNDCSGLWCAVMALAGLPPICTSSFGFAALIRDNGLEVSRDFAMHNAGCVAIENPFGSPSLRGANGHIVGCVGDGTDADIEEMGTRWGCVESHFSNRGLDFFGKLPGVLYTPPAPPTVHKEPTMFVQQHHYNDDGTVSGPAKPAPEHASEVSNVRVSEDGKSILALFGASIANDRPLDPAHPFVIRVWKPTERPLPASAHFESVAGPYVLPGSAQVWGVASVSDGSSRRLRLT